jgi:ERCC4-type nuclease
MKEPSLIILEDTREQDYLTFTRFKHVEFQQSQCLPVGDYACVINGGSLSSVVFERKSKGDLWGTMTSYYERFKNEYKKSIELGIKLVLITECDIEDIAKGFIYNSGGGRMVRSKVDGGSMCKKLETLRVKHGLEVVYCNGRSAMKRYMYERWCAEARLALKTGA